ncbi:MAG: hypothetical protein DWQ36_06265 [Acidobacteria bacterium]|nr:MAG: hypothetical protein DWQ30_19270 [Acidobacteriota bacterium]REK09649.1 MAG: hypothetical protein DWQ36_06265 [Acidobacteriota bacterium]
MNRSPTAELPHDEAWRLLPWLANGSLEGEELCSLLDHLKGCPTCREELRFLPELRAAQDAFPEVDDGSEAALRRVLARVERGEPAKGGRAGGEGRVAVPLRALRDLIASPRGVRVALASQLAVIVVLVGVLAMRLPSAVSAGSESRDPATEVVATDATFRTLSDGEGGATDRAGVADGLEVRLVFAPEVTAAELLELLRSTGGEIVAGPSSVGAFTARLSSRDVERESTTLELLRGRSEVLLAEPVAWP